MSRIAIMQPYFFPYLGYFSLIKHTDKFILLDEVQFIRHGWIERNRIIKYPDDWLYIKVPLIKHARATIIRDVRINNSTGWQNVIFAQLGIYKKIAPFYFEVMDVVEKLLNTEYNCISSLNRGTLIGICNYLNIKTEFEVFSEMNLKIETPKAPDEWALNICKALGGIKEYWNPPEGQYFFDKSKYENRGIKLSFQKIETETYDQRRTLFQPYLSIIDVMMFNSIDKIHRMLDNYSLL